MRSEDQLRQFYWQRLYDVLWLMFLSFPYVSASLFRRAWQTCRCSSSQRRSGYQQRNCAVTRRAIHHPCLQKTNAPGTIGYAAFGTVGGCSNSRPFCIRPVCCCIYTYYLWISASTHTFTTTCIRTCCYTYTFYSCTIASTHACASTCIRTICRCIYTF